ncbi:MAG: hypothetical protein DI629_01335 [Mesorhizobium amorphae]|nr:MAG: hypothetical protein DI629_01335 [Mesorhizobium amorphae]
MSNILKTIALAATLGVGTSAVPAVAHADSLFFSIGQNGPEFGLISDHGSRYRDRDRDWREDRRHGEERWDRRGRRDCSPGRALDKAERMGVRRAFVRDVGRRTIEIGGRQRGDRVSVTFARAPGCPVINW